MEVMQELEVLHTKLRELCDLTERMMAQYSNETSSGGIVPEVRAGMRELCYESVYPLCMESGFFKGKNVVAVIFPDGVRVETPTWKKLVEVILKRCNDDVGKHRALMELRNRIQGRSRKLLANGSTGMRSPLKIDRGLYMETHYDTESLLRIMKIRILDAVGYDYQNIQVAIRND